MIRLHKTVGASHTSREDDVMALKRSLGDLGYYRPNPASGWHVYPDRELFGAVEAFQDDQGLQVDGVVKPDGPTLQRLNATVERKRRREDWTERREAERKAQTERQEREARIPSPQDLERQAHEGRTREEIARYLDLRRRRGHHMFWPHDQIQTDLDRNPSRARSLFDHYVRNPDVMSHIRRGGK